MMCVCVSVRVIIIHYTIGWLGWNTFVMESDDLVDKAMVVTVTMMMVIYTYL